MRECVCVCLCEGVCVDGLSIVTLLQTHKEILSYSCIGPLVTEYKEYAVQIKLLGLLLEIFPRPG